MRFANVAAAQRLTLARDKTVTNGAGPGGQLHAAREIA